MPLKEGKEHYTKFSFHESGRVTVRRIQRIELQDRLGQPWIFTGEDLPEEISVHTGDGYKGEHLLQILSNPQRVRPKVAEEGSGPLPSGRDVVAMVIGYFVFTTVALVAGALRASM
jgi:hypothetical protein